jgi:hypothetical protein
MSHLVRASWLRVRTRALPTGVLWPSPITVLQSYFIRSTLVEVLHVPSRHRLVCPAGRHQSGITAATLSPLMPNPRSGSSFLSGQVHHQASRTDDDDGIVAAPGSRTAQRYLKMFATGAECTATLRLGPARASGGRGCNEDHGAGTPADHVTVRMLVDPAFHQPGWSS